MATPDDFTPDTAVAFVALLPGADPNLNDYQRTLVAACLRAMSPLIAGPLAASLVLGADVLAIRQAAARVEAERAFAPMKEFV